MLFRKKAQKITIDGVFKSTSIYHGMIRKMRLTSHNKNPEGKKEEFPVDIHPLSVKL
jgi:hypothetical protein